MISTSAVDLELLVREGRFSQSLYEALRGMSIALPPLRDRGFDIIRLAERFIAIRCVHDGREPDAVRLRPDAIDALLRHPWPGNLTEIVAVMYRACAAATNDRISAADLAI